MSDRLERKGRDQAEADRDIARATVSELVTALTGLERRFLDPKPGDPGGSCWCDPYRYLELQGHEDECEVARAALEKAKEETR